MVVSGACWPRVLSYEFCGSVAAEPPDLRSVKSDAVGWLCCASLFHECGQVWSHDWIHLPFLFLIHLPLLPHGCLVFLVSVHS